MRTATTTVSDNLEKYKQFREMSDHSSNIVESLKQAYEN